MNFETPNVIDPGDNVPSTPARSLAKDFENRGGSRISVSSNESDSERIIFKPGLSRTIKLNYQDDADDEPTSQPTDPESGYEKEGLVRPPNNSPSSPTMEQTRLFAAAMLNESERRGYENTYNFHKSKSPVRNLFGGRKKRYSRDQDYLRDSLGLNYPNAVMDQWRLERRRKCAYCVIVSLLIATMLSVFGVLMRMHGEEHGDRTGRVREFLATNQVSSAGDLADAGSPQHRAARWIANFDAERLDVPSSPADEQDYLRFIQRYSLVVLYYALGGEKWAGQLNFLSDDHECGWNEEIPDENREIFAVGVSCNTLLHVDSLLIPSNNLQGSLPVEIRHLKNLKFISLKHNEVSGEIPPALQHLNQLEYLDLKFNRIEGSIPDYIGQLPHLQVLGLSRNKLVGSLPASLSALHLKTLAVDDNDLTGDLSPLRLMTPLKYLYAQNNAFTGNLFRSILMAELPSLVEIDLSGNSLTAADVPSRIFTLPALRLLDASDNRIAGKLPDDLPPNNVLEYLSFRGNAIGSSVPDGISNFGRLTHLDLERNALTGTIPASVASLTNMEYLFLGKNAFSAQPIPGEIKEMVRLKELSLDDGNFGGEMPVWIGGMSHLTMLDVRENRLEGSLDKIEFGNFPVMKYMMLSDNRFTGTIPASMGDMGTLEVLSLYHNNLTGEVGPICSGSNDLYWLATDCSSETFSCTCCDKCCSGDDCFGDDAWDKLETSKWDHSYSRAEYAFNPNILHGVVDHVEHQPRGGAR